MNKNKYKFIAVVTVLFLMPFIILSKHFLYDNTELMKKDALSYMDMRTKTVSNIAAEILAINYDVSRLAYAPDFVNASGDGRKKLMEKKIKENPSIYSGFSVLNSAGKETVKTGANSPKDLRDYSGTEIFRQASLGAESSGAVEYGEYTPPALVLAQPVVKKIGEKPQLFVLARMSLAYMGELVRVVGKNSSGDLGLIDAGGQLIADSLGRAIMTPGIKAPPEVLRAVDMAYENNQDSFRNEAVFKGRSYLVSVARIGGTRWWIFEVVDAKLTMDHRIAAWARRVITLGIMLMVIFGFVSYYLAMLWLVPKQQQITGESKTEEKIAA